MTNAIRLNHFEKKIYISKSFQKAAMNPTSREYSELMEVINNHPNYTLDQRKIKTNPKKETYAGLTYDYMREYIVRNSKPEEKDSAIKELEDNIFISKCHAKSQRYPKVKQWFLEKYPEVELYFKTIDNEPDANEIDNNSVEIDNAA